MLWWLGELRWWCGEAATIATLRRPSIENLPDGASQSPNGQRWPPGCGRNAPRVLSIVFRGERVTLLASVFPKHSPRLAARRAARRATRSRRSRAATTTTTPPPREPGRTLPTRPLPAPPFRTRDGLGAIATTRSQSFGARSPRARSRYSCSARGRGAEGSPPGCTRLAWRRVRRETPPMRPPRSAHLGRGDAPPISGDL